MHQDPLLVLYIVLGYTNRFVHIPRDQIIINTSRSRQDGRQFAEDIFEFIIFNENVMFWFTEISSKGPIGKKTQR